jgi:hypothetical protein
MNQSTITITCNCDRHSGTSAVIRDPGHALDADRIHKLVHVAHHPFMSRAQSVREHGPWKA